MAPVDIQPRKCWRASSKDWFSITIYLLSSFLTIEIWRAESFCQEMALWFQPHKSSKTQTSFGRIFQGPWKGDSDIPFFPPKQRPVTASQEHTLVPTEEKGLSREALTPGRKEGGASGNAETEEKDRTWVGAWIWRWKGQPLHTSFLKDECYFFHQNSNMTVWKC